MTHAPAGWYADPDPNIENPSLRYWDGTAWTAHTAPVATQAAPAGPTTPDGEPLAGWWWRVLAYVIDSFIVGVGSSLLAIPAQLELQRDLEPVTSEWDREIARSPGTVDWGEFLADHLDVLLQNAPWLVGPSLILTVIYWTVFLRWKGGTPGKLMLGMRVRLRGQPGTLPWSSIAARLLMQFGIVWTLWIVAMITGSAPLFVLAGGFAAIWLIDPLWATWDSKRQTLHDKLAGTNVVRPR